MNEMTEARASPISALIAALDETLGLTDALISAYRLKVASIPQNGPGLRRVHLRTLSALRAALKSKAKTESSIRKLKHSIASGAFDAHR